MSLAVKKYSKALFEVATEENCLDDIYEEFQQIYNELKENAEFKKTMQTELLSVNEKEMIFEKALEGKNNYLLNFFKMLIHRKRTDEICDMFIEFEEAYKREKNILEVSAVTAVELNESEIDEIKKMLEDRYQKTVLLTTSVDASIIGGMVLYVGDTVLDASVKARLNGLKKQMKQIKLT